MTNKTPNEVRFIQRKDYHTGQLETVSECHRDGRKSAAKVALEELMEYSMSDNSARYYVSSRPCSDWREQA